GVQQRGQERRDMTVQALGQHGRGRGGQQNDQLGADGPEGFTLMGDRELIVNAEERGEVVVVPCDPRPRNTDPHGPPPTTGSLGHPSMGAYATPSHAPEPSG